jgi:phosphoglycerol transferase MdoB-like AlkP superfamily enzyme
MLKTRLILIAKYFLYWLLFFVICRLLFLFYEWPLSKNLGVIDWFNILWHGIPMDLSATGYLLLLPCLFMSIFYFLRDKTLAGIINIYTYAILFICIFLVIADMELYRYWGFRLDATPLMYLNTPAEMAASASTKTYLFLGLFLSFSMGICIVAYKKLVLIGNKSSLKGKWFQIPIFLIIGGMMIIPIRGGFGIAPMNTGTAYFHKNNFANHAAINVIWNVGYSLTNDDDSKLAYPFFDKEKKEQLASVFFNQRTNACTQKLALTRPDVLLIIMESFTAKALEPLGGKPGITPQLGKFCKEGLLFTNFYASGDRSDKGLVAILSGFPALTNTSIIKYPKKTEKLPHLAEILSNQGYSTSFYYGGELDFANLRSYLTLSKFGKEISKTDFPKSECNSKWGVHDEFMFNRLYEDIKKEKEPYFKTLFTLSSHEPFEVPDGVDTRKMNEEEKFLHSMHYTDSCLGNFINKLKKLPEWKNLLVVIMADHGHKYPGDSPNYLPEKFHIPMVWLGGAIKNQPEIIAAYSGQCDFLNTLLCQLDLPRANTPYSSNIFANIRSDRAFYLFNEGFGLITDTAAVSYDHKSNSLLYNKNNKPTPLEDIGKAMLQTITEDFQKK